MRHKKTVPFNGNTRKHVLDQPERDDVWVNASGKHFRLKDMSTDHLVNAISALLRDQLRADLGLDRTRYQYIPNAWAQNGTVARALYVKMGEELRRRRES